MFDVFYERANHLSDARRLVADDVQYTSALALLAVHSAISWSDAMLVKISGRVVQGKRHMRAAEALEKQCISHKLNKDGLKHLKKLLTEKSYVSYGSQRITADEARTLSTSAERFEAWAMQTLRRLS